MARWKPFPGDAGAFRHDAASLKKHWKRLHRADLEPWPREADAREAWVHFHCGEFKRAVDTGLAAGGAGLTCAHKAQTIYATYLEPDEERRLELLLEVVERAEVQRDAEPENANAHYWLAHALGRYSQGISVAVALARGLGGRVKGALDAALEIEPDHADALATLGAFHAEVIGKVGRLLARVQGADAGAGRDCFRRARELAPHSPTVLVECARGLPPIDGTKGEREAEALWAAAAAVVPQDAAEWLAVDAVRRERTGAGARAR
ncbi:MAG: hypothetical protein KJ067_13450 [Vicinamibacteria bacterium]|nr:hypothetical protein [Vicinamibacteria bacterium]